jgi:hypothetical protein
MSRGKYALVIMASIGVDGQRLKMCSANAWALWVEAGMVTVAEYLHHQVFVGYGTT